MITNYIIIALLIALKVFLLAFILFEQFSKIFRKSKVRIEELELTKLRKEHISLTESEDEESEQQISKGKRASVCRSRRPQRTAYRPGNSAALNDTSEESSSIQIRLVGEPRFSSKFKGKKGRRCASDQESRTLKTRSKCVNEASESPAAPPMKSVPVEEEITKSFGEVESSGKRKSRKIPRRKKVFRRKNYKSKRGVKVVESWVRFNLRSRQGCNSGAVLKSKLESKIRKLELLIARKRSILQNLPVVYESMGYQVNFL